MNYIPVNRPYLDENDNKSVQSCISDGWISSEAPVVQNFEERFCDYLGVKHGAAVSSGTAAIDIVFASLNLKPGDEVIVPTFTIISCINWLIKNDVKPVFVDCDADTFNISTDQISNLITPRTRAILVVHIFGLCADLQIIRDICDQNQLIMIEDAAEAHGLRYRDQLCGSIGDVSIFSFYANKFITTGEGGFIASNDDKLISSAKKLRNLCFGKDRFVHESIGWNYRMTAMQASLGVSQLTKINFFLKKKLDLVEVYYKKLSSLEWIILPPRSTLWAQNTFWVFPIRIRYETGVYAKKLSYYLQEKGVGTRPFFYPLHLQPALTDHALPLGSCPNAEDAYQYGLYLPSGNGNTVEEAEIVSDIICNIDWSEL